MKNFSPLVSIIMPTFNRGRIIERAINSILRQSYEIWELIIVDDCSTDNTTEVVSKFLDKRIQYKRLDKNSGACFARNVGIGIAKGEYITFLDSDNEFKNDKIEKQLNYILTHNIDMVCCRYLIQFQDNKLRPSPLFVYNSDVEMHRWLMINGEKGYVDTNTIFAKKRFVEDIGFDSSIPRWQDYEMVLRFSLKYNLGFQDEILVINHVQSDSISMQSDKLKQAVQMIYQKNQDCIESDPEVKKVWHYIIAKAEFKSENCDKKIIKQQYKCTKDSRCMLLYLLCAFGLRKTVLKIHEKKKG